MLFEQILHLVRKIFHVRTDLDQKLFVGHNFNIICFAYKRTDLIKGIHFWHVSSYFYVTMLSHLGGVRHLDYEKSERGHKYDNEP